MPRLEFEDAKQFTDWLKTVDRSKYRFYYASEDKAIMAVPTVSTPPIMYGLLEEVPADTVRRIAEDFQLTVLRTKRFEWKVDSPPGAVYR